MTRDELKAFVKEHAGIMIADAVEQAVAKHQEKRPDVLAVVRENAAKVQEALDAVRTAGAEETKAAGIQLQQREKGAAIGRYIRAQAAARMGQLKGDVRSPAAYLTQWGDKDLAALHEKAMSAGVGADGGFLVPTQFSTDYVELLRPASIVRRLNPVTLPMPTGTLRIPKITAGSSAAYLDENGRITTSQLTTGSLTLTFKKLASLVPVSGDLVRYSSIGADTLVRDDSVRASAQAENAAMLRSDGTNGEPKGITRWATSRANSAGTSLANMTTDLGAAILALMNNNIPEGRWAWMMSPRNWNSLMTIQNTNGFFVFRDEMSRGTLWQYPYAVSTAVPGSGATGEMVLANMADVVIGESQNLIVDTSLEASYVDGVTGATVSAFQNDQLLVRTIAEHDLIMRRGESAHVIEAMSW